MISLIRKIKVGDRLLINDEFDYLKVLGMDDFYVCAVSETTRESIYICKFADEECNPYYFNHSGQKVVIHFMSINYFVPQGSYVFGIMGGYDKRKQVEYYMVAKDMKTAKKKFVARYAPVLKPYSLRRLSDEEADEIIRKGPYKTILNF